MKKMNVALTSILSLGLLMNAGGLNAHAEEDSKTVDEQWGNPAFVYGDALTKSQIEKTKSLLDIQNSTVDETKVSGKDMVKFLGDGNPNARMFSSALITHSSEKDSGVVVQIVTPENITKVTTTQYSNALITAGATDVSVKVASPIKVTGESALTGIYKAYEVNGDDLDKDRMKVAQDELSAVTDIVDSNKDEKEFNEESLNKAMIDIKEGLANATNNGENSISDKAVRKLVNEKLQQNGLDKYITPQQVDQLVDFASAYATTGAVSSDAVHNQLNKLTEDVKNNVAERAKEIGGNLKDTVTDDGFWDSVKGFFANIGDSIASIFK